MFVCDTNIVSELTRPEPNRGVVNWVDSKPFLYVSAVTVEEMTFGLTINPKVRALEWFKAQFKEKFKVLPIDEEIAEMAGVLRGKFRKQGRPREQADMLIAATAKIYGLTLVTRNVRDFEGCEVAVLNPFS
ncbi:MAG: type II toxin-antitoxin system VapC family toxin [Spirulina sp. SIO3F2]|nr:type II toxin-antitoxin system VapC family toxin [Spirulina sp. SIO3F2]